MQRPNGQSGLLDCPFYKAMSLNTLILKWENVFKFSISGVYLARATLTHMFSATAATSFPVAPGESRKMLAHGCAWETLNRSVEA